MRGGLLLTGVAALLLVSYGECKEFYTSSNGEIFLCDDGYTFCEAELSCLSTATCVSRSNNTGEPTTKSCNDIDFSTKCHSGVCASPSCPDRKEPCLYWCEERECSNEENCQKGDLMECFSACGDHFRKALEERRKKQGSKRDNRVKRESVPLVDPIVHPVMNVSRFDFNSTSYPGDIMCPPGSVPCLDTGKCDCSNNKKEGGEGAPKGGRAVSCRPGTTFCIDTGSCSRKCGRADQNEDKDDRRRPIMCGAGETFCLSTGRCSRDCGGKRGNSWDEKSKRRKAIMCKPGQTFCLNSGKCSYSCNSGNTVDNVEKRPPPIQCPAGLTFCLNSGECRPDCGRKGRGNKDRPKVSAISCGPMQTFCLNTGRCETHCGQDGNYGGDDGTLPEPISGDDDGARDDAAVMCRPGQTFCLDTGRCQRRCGRGKGVDDDKWEHLPILCAPGETLCMSTGKCERQCKKTGGNDGQEQPPTPITCGSRGMTFCFNTGRCQRKCSEDDGGKGDGQQQGSSSPIICHGKETFCLNTGKCQRKCGGKDDHDGEDQPRYPPTTCRAGETFCLETGMCQSKCGRGDGIDNINNEDPPPITCGQGHKFCLETGSCQMRCSKDPQDGEDDGSDEISRPITCGSGLKFCLETGSCQVRCSKDPQDGEDDDSDEISRPITCDSGLKFCLETGSCQVRCGKDPQDDEDDDSDEVSRPITCGSGRKFCLETGSCQIKCGKDKGDDDDNSDEVVQPITCSRGKKFCLSSGTCERKCGGGNVPDDKDDDGDNTQCRRGQVFCLESGRCQKQCGGDTTDPDDDSDDQGSRPDLIKCAPGEVFCLTSGTCQRTCGNAIDDEDKPKHEKPIHCRRGEVFCLETGTCSRSCGVTDGDGDDDVQDSRKPIHCRRGEVFCLDTGTCSRTCGAKPDGDEKDGPKGVSLGHCPRGYQFCLESERCVPIESDNDSRKPRKDAVYCPDGFVYCLEADACVAGDCGGVFNGKKPDKDKKGRESCPKGQVFDLSTGKCCSGGGDSIGSKLPTKSCGENEVYCPSSDKCVSQGDTNNCRCGFDKVYCDGKCEKQCPAQNVGCPNPKDIPGIGFGSCTINQQCNKNETDDRVCCVAEDGFRQCVDRSTGTAATEPMLDLAESCRLLGDEPSSLLRRPDDETCSDEDPSTCDKPGTLCCNGRCWGLPVKPQKDGCDGGVGDCPAGKLPCGLLGMCLYESDWEACSCPTGQVPCKDEASGFASCRTECGTGRLGTPVWTPHSVDSGTEFSLGQSMTNKWKDSFKENTDFNVVTVGDSGGSLEYRDGGEWKKVDVGTTLNKDTKLRSQNEDGATQTAWAEVTLEGKDRDGKMVKGTLAHVALPDLTMDPPVLSGTGSNSAQNELRVDVKEDSIEPIPVKSMFSLRETEDNANLLEKHYGELYRQMEAKGLWRYAALSEEGVANSLAKVFAVNGGRREMGVAVRFKEQIEKKVDYVNKLYSSTDGGKSWSLLENPNEPVNLPYSSLSQLRFDLPEHFVGKISLSVTPYAEDIATGEPKFVNEPTTVTVNVLSANDPPMAVFSPSPPASSELPAVPYDIVSQDNEGFYVRSVAELFYVEPDPPMPNVRMAGLGAAILAAPQASKDLVGRWQYSSGTNATDMEWKDLPEDLAEDVVLPEGLASMSHLGPVKITRYLQYLACDIHNIRPDPKWDKLRMKWCPEREEEGAMGSSSLRRAGGNGDDVESNRNDDDGKASFTSALESLMEEVSTGEKEDFKKFDPDKLKTQKISVLLLGPLSRLRYQPWDETSAWDQVKAIVETKLFFTAWDMSDGRNEGDRITLGMPLCFEKECGDEGSLSRDFSILHIAKRDCGGDVVVDNELTDTDKCGVCGGDGSSCSDCAGVTNGTSVWDVCGFCRRADDPAGTDCNGACGEFEMRDGECVAVGGEPNKNVTNIGQQCDGAINECNICYGGSTGLTASAGKAEGCSECGQVMDLCGICHSSEKEGSMDCDKSEKLMEIMDGGVHDKLRSPDVVVKLKKEDMATEMDKRKSSCWLHPRITDVISSVQSSKVRKISNDEIRVTFPNPEPSMYSVSCGIASENGGSAREHSTGNGGFGWVTVVDSQGIAIQRAWTEETEDGHIEVMMEFTNSIRFVGEMSESSSGMACFFSQQGNNNNNEKKRPVNKFIPGGATISKEESTITTVRCGKLPAATGGVFRLGLLLKEDPKMLKKPGLSTAEVSITAPGPKVKEVRMSKNGRIDIVFDQRMSHGEDGLKECKEIFDDDSLQMIGSAAICELKGNKLSVKNPSLPEKNDSTSSSTVLRFRPNNKLRAANVDPTHSRPVSSEEQILIPETEQQKGDGGEKGAEKRAASIILVGDSNLCFGSRGKFRARLSGDADDGDVIEWRVTKRRDREGKQEQNEEEKEQDVVLSGEVVLGEEQQEENEGRNKKKNKKKNKNNKKNGGGKIGRKIQIAFETEELVPGEEYNFRAARMVNGEAVGDAAMEVVKVAAEEREMVANVRIPKGAISADKRVKMTAKVRKCGEKKKEEEEDANVEEEDKKQTTEGEGDKDTTEGGRRDQSRTKNGNSKKEGKNKRNRSNKKDDLDKIEYHWVMTPPPPPESIDLSTQRSSKLLLKPGMVQGGHNYTVKVQAIPVDNPTAAAVATAQLRVRAKGVRAKSPIDKASYPQGKAVRLDASLSQDKDNTGTPLTFKWSCALASTGEPAYAAKEDNITLNDFLGEEMNKAKPVIPAGLLSPGMYNCTVIVSSKVSSSSKSVEVTIKPGGVPAFHLSAKDSVIDPRKEFVIKALVENAGGACVYWECVQTEGSAPCIDLAEFSDSAKRKCFSPQATRKTYHLAIPENVLEPGEMYNFRLSGVNTAGSSSADVAIIAMPLPSEGSCSASPVEAVALETEVTITCDGFSTDDSPSSDELEYEFSVSSALTGGRQVYLGEATGDADGVEWSTVVPAGVLDITVKACDGYGLCRTVKVDNSVASNVGTIEKSDILGLSEQVVELKEDKEFKAAQSLGRQISSTLKSSPELWSAYGQSFCTLDLSMTASVVEELEANMDGVEKMREAVETMETLPGSDCMKLAFEVKKEKEEAEASDKVVVADQGEDKERDDFLEQLAAVESSVKKMQKKITEVIGNARKTSPGANKRRRRSTEKMIQKREAATSPDAITRLLDTVLSFVEEVLTVTDWDTLIDVADTMLDSVRNTEAVDSLLTTIDDAVTGMCTTTTTQSRSSRVSSDRVDLTVLKTDFAEESDAFIEFGNGSSCSFGDTLPRIFTSFCTDEAVDESSLEDVICDAICSSVGTIEEDIFTPREERFEDANQNETDGKIEGLAGPITFLRLQRPDNGRDVTSMAQKTKLDSPISLKIPITVPDSVSGGNTRSKRAVDSTTTMRPVCRLWIEETEQWDEDQCELQNWEDQDSGETAEVSCKCDSPGYVGVFFKSGGVWRELDEEPIWEKRMRFRCNNSYDEVVGTGQDKEDFVDAIQEQLADLLSTTQQNIDHLEVTSGSIVVDFTLAAYDGDDVSEFKKSYDDLAEAFKKGDVELYDDEGNKLNIQPQCVSVGDGECDGEKDTLVTYILIGVASAVVVAVIVFVIVALCIKRKKSKDKLSPLMTSNTTGVGPTYRSFQFQDSLEGSKASMAKVKTVQQSGSGAIPAYMPSQYNYESMQKQSRGMVRMEELDAEDPARYDEPTQSELDRSQPIPRDMAKRVEERLAASAPIDMPGTPLPGTPEHH